MFKAFKKIFIPCKENQYRPELLYGSFMFWAIIAMMFLYAIPLVFFANLPRNSAFADITKSAIINLTNQERLSMGLPELSENKELNEAAKEKALNMFANDYFDHFSPTGVSPWFWFEKNGYKYEHAGENLAIGFLEPEEVYKGWQDSFTHHQNLINNNYQDIGVAVVRGNFNGAPTTIVVQMFGSKKQEIPESIQIPHTAGTTKNKPSPKPELIVPKEEVAKKVAGSVGEAKDFKDIFDNKQSVNLKQETVKFFAFEFNDLMQKAIIVILGIIAIVSIISFVFYFKNQKPAVLAKIFVTLIALLVFAYLEKEKIVSIIPHNLTIQ